MPTMKFVVDGQMFPSVLNTTLFYLKLQITIASQQDNAKLTLSNIF